MLKQHNRVFLLSLVAILIFFLYECSKLYVPLLIGLDIGFIHPKVEYNELQLDLANQIFIAFSTFALGLIFSNCLLHAGLTNLVTKNIFGATSKITELQFDAKRDVRQRFIAFSVLMSASLEIWLAHENLYFAQIFKQLKMMFLFYAIYLASQSNLKTFLLVVVICFIIAFTGGSRFWTVATLLTAIFSRFLQSRRGLSSIILFAISGVLLIASLDGIRRSVFAFRTGIESPGSVTHMTNNAPDAVSVMDKMLIQRYGHYLQPFADLYTSRLNTITSIAVANEIPGYNLRVKGDIDRSLCLLPVWVEPCTYNRANAFNSREGFRSLMDENDITSTFSVGVAGSSYFLHDDPKRFLIGCFLFGSFFYILFLSLTLKLEWLSFYLYFLILGREGLASLLPSLVHISVGIIFFWLIFVLVSNLFQLSQRK